MDRVTKPLAGVLILMFILVVEVNILYRQTTDRRAPPGTLNTYAIGNSEDYHQYIYLIRRGREGNLLYHNAYSEESVPDVLLQPIYHIVGLLTAPLPFSVYEIFYLFHLLSLGVLFTAIFFLVRSATTQPLIRVVSAVFFFFATGFWSVISYAPFVIRLHPLTDYNFDLFMKYHVIPSHHNIAVALIIWAFLKAVKQTKKSAIISAVILAITGLVHPYIQFIGIAVITALALVSVIRDKTLKTAEAKTAFWVLLISLPGIVYYAYLYGAILRFEVATVGIFWVEKRLFALTDYLWSLGPLLPLSIPILLRKTTWKNPLTLLLVLWSFIPIILFLLPYLNVPVNRWRLFQSYQHIPLAMLSAMSLAWVAGKTKFLNVILVVAALAAALYGSVAYAHQYRAQENQDISSYFNIYIPRYILNVYEFLDTKTPPESVVITGEYAGSLLPSLTHNRVVIGHNGNNRRYAEKKADVLTFLSDVMDEDATRAFLTKYHVSYVLFGADAPDFRTTRYANMPFFREVYNAHGLASIVAVELDK